MQRVNSVLVLVTLLAVIACSSTVPLEKLYGIYRREYPKGFEILSLRRDGTFTQEVNLTGQPQTVVSGTWSFDNDKSAITFNGLLWVVGEFGEVEPDWRTPRVDRSGVEMVWFGIEIGSGGSFPYVREGDLLP